MDWALIIITLLAVILGLLVLAGLGLVISFVALTIRIRHATQSARTAMVNVGDLLQVVKVGVSTMLAAREWLKGFMKQRKGKGRE